MTVDIQYFILGGGTFGALAARRLSRKNPGAAISVIDTEASVIEGFKTEGFKTVCMDGIQFLVHNRDRIQPLDWIIPAIPVHTAYEWILRRLEPDYRVRPLAVPDEVLPFLPHPMRGNHGQAYASIADFLCPDDCPEPEDVCTVTGEPRPQALFKTLASIVVPGFRSMVLRSRQLAPGVGGYQVHVLGEILDNIAIGEGRVLLSTACQCHGVVDAFSIDRRE